MLLYVRIGISICSLNESILNMIHLNLVYCIRVIKHKSTNEIMLDLSEVFKEKMRQTLRNGETDKVCKRSGSQIKLKHMNFHDSKCFTSVFFFFLFTTTTMETQYSKQHLCKKQSYP